MAPLSGLRGFLVGLLVIVLWILALNWLFVHFMGQSYFVWYIKNGGLISTAAAFLALIWGKLESEQKDLLSWDPWHFVAACMHLAGLFVFALGELVRSSSRSGSDSDSVFLAFVEGFWDFIFSMITALLIFIAILGWLLVMAPLFYVLTLITGGLARREIRGSGQRAIYQRKGTQVSVSSQSLSDDIPEGGIDISLGNQAFAFTNAINAAVLLLARYFVEHSR